MSAGGLTDEEVICRILWRLARVNGWSRRILVHDLVSQTNVPNERYARQLCETAVASKGYLGHDPVNGEIWLEVPHDDL